MQVSASLYGDVLWTSALTVIKLIRRLHLLIQT